MNSNEQLKVEPPEPATLTVNKKVFGCDNLVGEIEAMIRCTELQMVLHHGFLVLVLLLAVQYSVKVYHQIYLIDKYSMTRIHQPMSLRDQQQEQPYRICSQVHIQLMR